jgi:hypothetical protein
MQLLWRYSHAYDLRVAEDASLDDQTHSFS